MTDISDLATAREEALREDALAAQRRARIAAAARPAAVECDQCSEPLPEARRLAVPGVRLCVTCQMAREARHRKGQA